MKTVQRILMMVLCAAIFGHLLATWLLSHASGQSGLGGLPLAVQKDLRAYLTSHGFRLEDPDADRERQPEVFHGNYQRSRPFSVTLHTRSPGTYGLSVPTLDVSMNYDFHGWKPTVCTSTEKAQAFAGMLDRWLMEHAALRLHAGQ